MFELISEKGYNLLLCGIQGQHVLEAIKVSNKNRKKPARLAKLAIHSG